MEVASPFAVSTGTNKRSLLLSTDDDIVMDSGRSGKRQRCSTGFASSPRPTVFGNTNGGEPSWYQQQLQHQQQLVSEMRNLIEQKNIEIDRFKNDNLRNQHTLSQVNIAHEKVLSENRILKKAVSIQQERQNQAAQEVVMLRRQGEESSERIRRLEQMNRQLSFVVESSSNNSHGFMGFGQPPPDVY